MNNDNRSRLMIPLLAAGFLGVGAGAFYLGRSANGTKPAAMPPPAATGPSEAGTGNGGAASKDDQPVSVQFEPETLQLAKLEVTPAAEGTLRASLKVTGSTEPNPGGVVKVTPRVPGKVTTVRANVGDTVRAGQVLASVASMDVANAQADYDRVAHDMSIAKTNLARQKKLAGLDAFSRPQVETARTRANDAKGEALAAATRVAAAQAGLTEAHDKEAALRAALAQAEAQAAVSRSRFERAEKLLKEQIVSRQDYEQAEADHRKAQADVNAARAGIAQGAARIQSANAQVGTAQAELAAARKRSEIAGAALSREEKVYQGGYVASKELFEAETAVVEAEHQMEAVLSRLRLLGGTPTGSNVVAVTAPIGGRVTERSVTLGETVTAEKELFTVIDLDTVWVQLSVYQKDAATIRPGQRVVVTADSAPDRAFRGEVAHIGDEVDPATRTVKIRCLIRNAGNRLKPGTFVTGEIEGASPARSVVVPQDAVQDVKGKAVVFVASNKEGEFVARPVKLGDRAGGKVQVAQGLKPGERVVTKNAFLVKSQAMKAELAEE